MVVVVFGLLVVGFKPAIDDCLGELPCKEQGINSGYNADSTIRMIEILNNST